MPLPLEREYPASRTWNAPRPTRATPPRRTRAPCTCCVRLLQPSRTQNGKMDSKQKNGKIPANKISERKNPHTRAQPHPGAHVLRTCCVRLLQPSRTQNGKMDSKPNSERKYSASRTWNEKKRIHARQFHPGAHVPPARATCACSEKAELRTGKSPQTKSQNAKIPTHTRNPTKAHTCPQHVLRALAPTKPNLERGKWTASKISERKNPTHARNPTKAHTCFARAACACSEKANLRTGKMDSKRRFL